MAKTVLWYLNQMQDIIGITRTTEATAGTDLVHTDAMIIEDVHKALCDIILDLQIANGRKRIRLIEDQYEYPLPSDLLQVRSVLHKWNDEWSPLDFIPFEEWMTSFDESADTGPYPTVFTVEPMTSAQVHYTGTITTADASDPPVLYDSAASFGITLSGEEIAPGDIIYNVTDNSYGYVDYITIRTADKVISGATASGGSATTLIDAGQDFSSVTVGMIISVIESGVGESWGVITNVDDGADTLTVTRIYGDHTTFDGVTYDVGPGTEIHLTASGLMADTEEGLVGGAENDFDASDSYQIEDEMPTLDTLKIKDIPSSSDSAGTRSLLVRYMQAPPELTELYQHVPINDAYRRVVLSKMSEYALFRQPDLIDKLNQLARLGILLPYEEELVRARINRENVNYGNEGPRVRGRRRPRYGTITWELGASVTG